MLLVAGEDVHYYVGTNCVKVDVVGRPSVHVQLEEYTASKGVQITRHAGIGDEDVHEKTDGDL